MYKIQGNKLDPLMINARIQSYGTSSGVALGSTNNHRAAALIADNKTDDATYKHSISLTLLVFQWQMRLNIYSTLVLEKFFTTFAPFLTEG